MMRWAILLGGLSVWAAHFFLLYAFASVLPGDRRANWLAIAATGVAVAIDMVILRFAIVLMRGADRRTLDRWIGQVGAVGAALSLTAILWQLLPALI